MFFSAHQNYCFTKINWECNQNLSMYTPSRSLKEQPYLYPSHLAAFKFKTFWSNNFNINSIFIIIITWKGLWRILIIQIIWTRMKTYFSIFKFAFEYISIEFVCNLDIATTFEDFAESFYTSFKYIRFWQRF